MKAKLADLFMDKITGEVVAKYLDIAKGLPCQVRHVGRSGKPNYQR